MVNLKTRRHVLEACGWHARPLRTVGDTVSNWYLHSPDCAVEPCSGSGCCADGPPVESDTGAAFNALCRFCADPQDFFIISKTKLGRFIVDIQRKRSVPPKRINPIEPKESICDAICMTILSQAGRTDTLS